MDGTAADEPATPLHKTDPRRLGAYELIGRLGTGGQGAVFLGRSPDGTPVAVKLLHPDLTHDARARTRFVREVSAAKRVARFCTAQVLDADVDGDRPYIVSEYVPGRSLHDLVRERGPLSGAALERLAIGTVTALAAIHQAGVVHRDFKPQNVLIGPDGPRVIDFGIARALDTTATVSSQVVGTPAYMAPEQIRGESAGPAADVFAWAGTMVFAATGNPPFGNESISVVVHRILTERPRIGDLPEPLRALVDGCLDKDPARRPAAPALLMRLLTEGRAGAGTRRIRNAGTVAGTVAEPATAADPGAYGAAAFGAAATMPAGPQGAPPAPTELLKRGATVAAERTPPPTVRLSGRPGTRPGRRAAVVLVAALVAAGAVTGGLVWSARSDGGHRTGQNAGYHAPDPTTSTSRPRRSVPVGHRPPRPASTPTPTPTMPTPTPTPTPTLTPTSTPTPTPTTPTPTSTPTTTSSGRPTGGGTPSTGAGGGTTAGTGSKTGGGGGSHTGTGADDGHGTGAGAPADRQGT